MIIDTVVLKVAYKPSMITDYRRFDGEDAVNRLVTGHVSKNGNDIMLFNNPTEEDKRIGYFPRVTLYKSINAIRGSFVNFKIECSLQKILFGNNVYEAGECDFEILLVILQDKLSTMGLWVEIDDLRNAYVSRVDYSKNIVLPHNCWMFLEWISKADLDSRLGRTDRDYQNGGSAFKLYTTQRHILAYDKVTEVDKSLYCSNRSVSNDDYSQRSLQGGLKRHSKKILS